jgi:hypothetical protein
MTELRMTEHRPTEHYSTEHRAIRHRPTEHRRARLFDDRGAATAEYAIATMAAVGFASLLVVIMQSDEVRGILTDLVRTALTVGG